MSANIPARGEWRQLDRRAEKPAPLTERDVQTPSVLVRLLMGLLEDVGLLTRRWGPRRLDFEDRTLDATGTAYTRLEHGFGGRVRYWIVDWSGAAAPNLRKDSTSTNNVLVLTSTSAGTATIRVEEAG